MWYIYTTDYDVQVYASVAFQCMGRPQKSAPEFINPDSEAAMISKVRWAIPVQAANTLNLP